MRGIEYSKIEVVRSDWVDSQLSFVFILDTSWPREKASRTVVMRYIVAVQWKRTWGNRWVWGEMLWPCLDKSFWTPRESETLWDPGGSTIWCLLELPVSLSARPLYRHVASAAGQGGGARSPDRRHGPEPRALPVLPLSHPRREPARHQWPQWGHTGHHPGGRFVISHTCKLLKGVRNSNCEPLFLVSYSLILYRICKTNQIYAFKLWKNYEYKN